MLRGLARPSLVRSVMVQSRFSSSKPSKSSKATSQKDLQAYQEKYRTFASDILASIPANGNLTPELNEKIAPLMAKYYQDLGIVDRMNYEAEKFYASREYEELVDHSNTRLMEFKDPMMRMTRFPLLNELRGNPMHDTRAKMEEFAEFMNIEEQDKEAFISILEHGKSIPNDVWAYNLQEQVQEVFDTYEDLTQDAIDTIERDFGAEGGNQNCDLSGIQNDLKPSTTPELDELEKKYLMDAEELEQYNFIEETRKKLAELEIEPLPSQLPEPF